MKDKKGSILDMFFFIAAGVILLIILIVFLYVSGLVNNITGQMTTSLGGGETIGSISNQTIGVYNSGLQGAKWIPVGFFVGMFLFIIVSSFLVRVSPLFFILYVFVIITAVIVSVPISNFYEGLLTDNVLGSTVQSFTASNFILLHLPEWIAVIGIVGLIFLFIAFKTKQDEGGYYG